MSNFQNFTNEAWIKSELHNVSGEIKDDKEMLERYRGEMMEYEASLVKLRGTAGRLMVALAEIEGEKR